MFNFSFIGLLKWFLIVVGLSRLIPLACPPDNPQKTLNSRIKFSYDYFDGSPPSYTWTELPFTFDVGRFGHTVATIDVTTNSSDSNTSTVGGRRAEADFAFSFMPQSTPDPAHTAFLSGHYADEQAPAWVWVQESDGIATGTLACVTITNIQPSSDQNDVSRVAVTCLPRYKPAYDEAEPVTIP